MEVHGKNYQVTKSEIHKITLAEEKGLYCGCDIYLGNRPG